jgi:hypothetical protein
LGARLRYAKVIDRKLFMVRGGRLHPGLDSEVVLLDEPGPAGAFLVLRAWGDDHGTVTEQWRIESPGGSVLYKSAPREIHLATPRHIEKLEDEISDLEFLFAAEDYEVVFSLDDRDVARATFPVRIESERAEAEA